MSKIIRCYRGSRVSGNTMQAGGFTRHWRIIKIR